MPRYDVKCRACGHVFETFARMSDTVFPCERSGCAGECDKIPCLPHKERVFAGGERRSHRFRFIPMEV